MSNYKEMLARNIKFFSIRKKLSQHDHTSLQHYKKQFEMLETVENANNVDDLKDLLCSLIEKLDQK